MTNQRVFDLPHYQALDQAKILFLRQFLPTWKKTFRLSTALDVACGVGHYSVLLRECGFDVAAVEGREDNAGEARRRAPGLTVHVSDVEELPALGLPPSDLVFCLGLLYHLENPLRTIRQLHDLTGKMMVVESMCTDDPLPRLELRDEGSSEDQGLRHLAFYPSEACLIKMLYRSGFKFVYRFVPMPDHKDFRSSRERLRARTMLLASKIEVASAGLVHADDSGNLSDPWETTWTRAWRPVHRMGGFAGKPWHEKVAAIKRRLGMSDRNGTSGS